MSDHWDASSIQCHRRSRPAACIACHDLYQRQPCERTQHDIWWTCLYHDPLTRRRDLPSLQVGLSVVSVTSAHVLGSGQSLFIAWEKVINSCKTKQPCKHFNRTLISFKVFFGFLFVIDQSSLVLKSIDGLSLNRARKLSGWERRRFLLLNASNQQSICLT